MIHLGQIAIRILLFLPLLLVLPDLAWSQGDFGAESADGESSAGQLTAITSVAVRDRVTFVGKTGNPLLLLDGATDSFMTAFGLKTRTVQVCPPEQLVHDLQVSGAEFAGGQEMRLLAETLFQIGYEECYDRKWSDDKESYTISTGNPNYPKLKREIYQTLRGIPNKEAGTFRSTDPAAEFFAKTRDCELGGSISEGCANGNCENANEECQVQTISMGEDVCECDIPPWVHLWYAASGQQMPACPCKQFAEAQCPGAPPAQGQPNTQNYWRIWLIFKFRGGQESVKIAMSQPCQWRKSETLQRCGCGEIIS
ncbi:MAG: hypothetical protein KDD70_17890 [Bdellovibrionales bacterium]|nr:hypothetical protein [Bdellovibrionales bacterium]